VGWHTGGDRCAACLLEDAARLSTCDQNDSKAESEEEKEHRKLLGVWHDDSQANRTMTMTLITDGTAQWSWNSVVGKPLFMPPNSARHEMVVNGKKLSMKTMGANLPTK